MKNLILILGLFASFNFCFAGIVLQTGTNPACSGDQITFGLSCSATASDWYINGVYYGSGATCSFQANDSQADISPISIHCNYTCAGTSFSENYYLIVRKIVAGGTISGITNIPNSTYSATYTANIPNANTYSWTLPTGITQTSSSSNTITVSISSLFTCGFIWVTGSNECGNGQLINKQIIRTSALPTTAGTITGTTNVCQGQNSVTYTVPTITNATSYVWTLPSGATGTSISNNITVNYSSSATSGNISVSGYNNCGSGTSSSLAIIVNPLPSASGTITGQTTVCQGTSAVNYSVPTISNATSYIWSLPSGATGTSTTNSITVDYSSSAVSGNITVKGHNACGDGIPSTLPVTVESFVPETPSAINGLSTLSQGQNFVNYSVSEIPNATSFIWSLPNGASGTSTSNSITVNYDYSAVSGNITVSGENSCGIGNSTSLYVTITPETELPGCQEFYKQTNTYDQLFSVNFPDENTGYVAGINVNTYTGVIFKTTDAGTNWTALPISADLLFSVHFLDVSNGYAVGANGTIVKTVDGGANWIAQNSSTTKLLYSVYFVDNNIGWAVGESGTILKTINGGVNWISQTSGTTNSLRSAYFVDSSVGYVVGENRTILKTTNGGSNWTTMISSASNSLRSVCFINIDTGFVVGQSIFKTTDGGVNWVEQSNVGDLYTSVCFNSTNTGYISSMNGVLLKTIDGGNNWLVKNSFPTGLYSLFVTNSNACYAVSITSDAAWKGIIYKYKCIPIYHYSFVSGENNVCSDFTYTYYATPVDSATSYIWSLPVGASGYSTSDSIVVTYDATASSGLITVRGSNSDGDGPISEYFITVNSLPVNAGTISGNATVCQGENSVTYTVPTITNATSYIWTLPSGATGTSTTNSITVDYGTSATSGNITVKGTNSCGDGTSSSLAITVNPLPVAAGTITGTTTVCQGQNTVTYTVPAINNATSYVWTLPSGATGTSTTNSITVDYGTSATSGNITVKGTNSCGDGTSSSLAITVNPLPVAAGTITGSATVCQGQNSVTYTVPTITNATSYIWTLPSGATGISSTNTITVDFGTSATTGDITVKGSNNCGEGAVSILPITVNIKPITPIITLNSLVLQSDAPNGNQWYNQTGLINGATNQNYTVTVDGDYYVIVTLSGCSSDPSNTINVTVTGIEIVETDKIIKVYPNPVSNELIIEIEGNNEKVNFDILNAIGQIVFKGNLVEKTTVQTSNFAPGVYVIKLENGKTFEFKKIIKE